MPLVFLSSYKNWPQKKVRIGKEEVDRSEFFPRLTIDEMLNIRESPPRVITEIGSWGTPTFICIDGNGKKLSSDLQKRGMSEKKMLDGIAEAQKQLGEPADAKTVDGFLKVCRDVEEPLEGYDMEKAVKALKGFDKLNKMTKLMVAESDKLRKRVFDVGEKFIGEQVHFARIDEDEAKKNLQKLKRAFKGTDLEKKVDEALKEIE